MRSRSVNQRRYQASHPGPTPFAPLTGACNNRHFTLEFQIHGAFLSVSGSVSRAAPYVSPHSEADLHQLGTPTSEMQNYHKNATNLSLLRNNSVIHL
jgi:hypothetical protein